MDTNNYQRCKSCGLLLYDGELVCPSCDEVIEERLTDNKAAQEQQVKEYLDNRAERLLKYNKLLFVLIIIVPTIITSIMYFMFVSQKIPHLSKGTRPIGLLYLMIIYLLEFTIFSIFSGTLGPAGMITKDRIGLLRRLSSSPTLDPIYYIISTIITITAGFAFILPKMWALAWDVYVPEYEGRELLDHIEVFITALNISYICVAIIILGIYLYCYSLKPYINTTDLEKRRKLLMQEKSS